jgi:REP element-mobilizing transposase RayT
MHNETFEIGRFYHVYNRGNNKENIFLSARNYVHFLNLFDKYLSLYLDLFVYCLMPNHFHLLIRVKSIDSDDLGCLLSRQFRIFFMAYAKGFNSENGRVGSLFQKGFKRVEVNEDCYLTAVIVYIHLNPVKARLVARSENWKFSSYRQILDSSSQTPTQLEVIEWFGGREKMIAFHEECIDLLSL